MSWINGPVNSPKHYTDSHPGMECIDLTADTTFCLGNCCKYLWRYHSKGRPLEDLEKARWYLCRVIDYGEKIAWTRQQYDILTALVAHTVGVDPEHGQNSSKATPTSPSSSSTNSSNGKETSNEHTHPLRPIRHSDRHQRTGGGGVSSQYCKPTGSDPVWRCPVCGQWWQLDLPDGDFWEPMSTLKAFLFYHVKWKAERKHRKAGI